MESAITVLFLSSIVFFLRICFFIIGFFKERRRTQKQKTNHFEPFVSIVVPARNEEQNIEGVINSLKKINYPKDKFEVIIVNDRSTDGTRELVENAINGLANFKLVNIENEAQKHQIPGKAGAVHVGVENSIGEVIFVTDADCTVQPNWIKKIVKLYYDKDTGFVTSYTNVVGSRFFDKIQAVEWIYMHTMAMGGVGMNQPLGCYGNNLTFRRSYYLNFGGYAKIPFSVTEDLALQKAFHSQNYRIHYYIDPETTVDTKPVKNITEYFSQHHRWARGGLNLGWRAVIFVLSSFAIWAGFLYFAFFGDWFHLLILLLIRIFGDLVLLISPLSILKKISYIFLIPIAVLFFLLVELTIPFSILNENVKWKDQIFKST